MQVPHFNRAKELQLHAAFRLHLSKDSIGTLPRTEGSSRFPRCATAAHCLGPREVESEGRETGLRLLFLFSPAPPFCFWIF